MAPFAATISTLYEFESMLEIFDAKTKVNCFGTNLKGERCGNLLAKVTRNEIKSLLSQLVVIIKSTGNGSIDLLQRLSSLAMCKRHQCQAVKKCTEWMNLFHDDEEVHARGHGAFGKRDLSASRTSAAQRKSESNSTATSQTPPQAAGSKGAEIRSRIGFDDSGYVSGDEKNSITQNSRTHDHVGEPTSSVLNDYKLQGTPQRRPPHISPDSGFSEPSEDKFIKEEIPESPSTASALRRHQRLAENAKLPSPTVLQQPDIYLLSKTEKPGPKVFTKRYFEPCAKFSPRETTTELKKLLKTPLPKMAEKEGHIYSFQVDGYQYTKIGYTTQVLAVRTSQHKRCGWWNPFVMIHQLVNHVYRVEQIIHKHLDANRFCEVKMDEGSNGRKCDHQKHIEWFDVDFTKMYAVVKAWSCWMQSGPYVLINGENRLSSRWTARLQTLPGEACHKDWLQWLSCYLPDSMTWLNGAPLAGMIVLKSTSQHVRLIVFKSAKLDEDEYEPLEKLWSGYGEGSYHKAPARIGTW